MTRTASDVLIETIYAWGVDVIFGIPGDGINGIVEALRKRADAIRFVQVRHEESAAFMACGYAKHTGRLGCCLATSGPGGIHLLNGLYDAKMDGQPVLAITGMQFHDLTHTHSEQDVEFDKLLRTSPCTTYGAWARRTWRTLRILHAARRSHTAGWRTFACPWIFRSRKI